MPKKKPTVQIKPGTPTWDESDAAALREYLVGPAGQRFLSLLHFSRPKVSGYVPAERAVQSDERAGYEKCIEDILAFADPGQVTDADLSAHRQTTDTIASQSTPAS